MENDCSLLSEIKPIELETLMIGSLVTSRFCISWSDDDKIAIVADDGVFIFELWPTSTNDHLTIALLKHSISPSSRALSQHSQHYIKGKDRPLWQMQRKNAFQLALDPSVSIVFEKPYSFISSHIIQCEFSPKIDSECYISCLTNEGSVQIFKKDFNKWISIINVNELWKSYCEIDINCKNINYEDFKTTIQQLKITAMKWLKQPQTGFITAHKNGSICLWNVCTSHKNLSLSVGTCIHSNLQPCALGTGFFNKSDCLTLIVGSLTGVVKGFFSGSYLNANHQEFDLWTIEDCIAPDLITTMTLKDNLLVLAAKRHVLLISKLIMNELIQMHNVNTEYLVFSAAITSLIKWQDSFLLSLLNHNLYNLSIEQNELHCNLSNIDVEVRSKHKNSYNCYGLALSRNRAIWVMVSSTKLNYDSLNDITFLSIYTTEEKNFKILKDYTSCGLIDKLVKTYQKTKLHDIYDFLELKRLELLFDESRFKKTFECNDEMTLLELKLLLWEAKLKQYCNSADIDSFIAALETLIAKQHSMKILNKYENLDCLTDIEKKSLKLHLNFLSALGNKVQIVHEECRICSSEIEFKNVRISECSNNHKFPRCCISLLPCDQFPYASCQKCDTVALCSFVSDDERHCIFCDGLLVLSTRFRQTIH